MIPHNMTLFKLLCVKYQFHRQTLPIMKGAKFNFENMFQQERNLYPILNRDVINNMYHMRTESSSVILSKKWFKSWNVMPQKCQIKLKPKGIV